IAGADQPQRLCLIACHHRIVGPPAWGDVERSQKARERQHLVPLLLPRENPGRACLDRGKGSIVLGRRLGRGTLSTPRDRRRSPRAPAPPPPPRRLAPGEGPLM